MERCNICGFTCAICWHCSEDKRYWCCCDICGNTSKAARTKEGAIKNWNKENKEEEEK